MYFLPDRRISFLLVLVSLLVLLCVAGCIRSAPPVPLDAPANNTPAAPASLSSEASAAAIFVGDEACADCHASTFREHQHSRHAITLHSADRSSLGRLAPRPGALPGSKAQLVQVGDGYQIQMPGGSSGPLHYALGSGKSGMTYVTLMGSHVFEMRASYFPNEHQWKITPGQKNIPKTVLGVDHKEEDARACIQCHVTTLPPDSNVPEKRFFGVGCEACHGAGGAHVAAMQSNPSGDINMERLGKWDARRVNDLCGKCHRNAESAGMAVSDAPDLSVTSRFQPYALMLSRCYKESGNTLSCNTCHNPHQNTSHDMRAYEAACLRCHSQKTAAEDRQNRQTRETRRKEEQKAEEPQSNIADRNTQIVHRNTQKVCPVNPRAGCVGCHMPRKPLLSGTGISTTAPDHFIRVRRPAQEAKWAREAATAPAPTSMGASGK